MFSAPPMVSSPLKSYPTLMRVYCNLSFFGLFRIRVATSAVAGPDETNFANSPY